MSSMLSVFLKGASMLDCLPLLSCGSYTIHKGPISMSHVSRTHTADTLPPSGCLISLSLPRPSLCSSCSGCLISASPVSLLLVFHPPISSAFRYSLFFLLTAYHVFPTSFLYCPLFLPFYLFSLFPFKLQCVCVFVCVCVCVSWLNMGQEIEKSAEISLI